MQKKKKKAKAAANAAAEGGAEEQPAVAGEAGGSEAVAAGTTAAPPKAKPVNASAVNVQSGHTYEQEFDLETKRGQVRAVAVACVRSRALGWGAGVGAAACVALWTETGVRSRCVRGMQATMACMACRPACRWPLQEGKMKNTPWGSSFRAPPEILHGGAAVAGTCNKHSCLYEKGGG